MIYMLLSVSGIFTSDYTGRSTTRVSPNKFDTILRISTVNFNVKFYAAFCSNVLHFVGRYRCDNTSAEFHLLGYIFFGILIHQKLTCVH